MTSFQAGFHILIDGGGARNVNRSNGFSQEEWEMEKKPIGRLLAMAVGYFVVLTALAWLATHGYF